MTHSFHIGFIEDWLSAHVVPLYNTHTFHNSANLSKSAPGTIPSRQDAPHPHEVILDPTGSFIVVPDLGADLVRVFSIDATTSLLTEKTPLKVTTGAGPRHGAFLKSGKETSFFLVAELDNKVRSFKVKYGMDQITFEEVFEAGTLGNTAIPAGAAAAECLVSVSPQTVFPTKYKSRN